VFEHNTAQFELENKLKSALSDMNMYVDKIHKVMEDAATQLGECEKYDDTT
jgi:hypothetical protein